MPYQIRKVRGKELFSVKNVETGKIHAHATTKANAKKQVKLLQAIDHGFVPQSSEDLEGGARLNPAVQSMITYLKSLYPHKTLMSVANEILKLTGQKMTGRGRKSPTATEIAKYVIGAIGAALAIAMAIFLLSNDDTSIKQSNIHPRLDKPGPNQIDTYPYTPSYTPTTTSSSSKPDVSLENLYSDPSLPSYTNMMNPGFGKVGIPKKKSGDKYSEYPSSSGTFSGNPKGYGRKRRLKKKKVM